MANCRRLRFYIFAYRQPPGSFINTVVAGGHLLLGAVEVVTNTGILYA